MANLIRCPWGERSDEERDYHDNEWGKPLHDERKLFELLILEGMQAGLSWTTVIKKRENFRIAFDDFDPEVIANYDDKKISELLANPGIIRNRLKVNAAITNAHAYLELKEKHGGLDPFLWGYVDGRPIVNSIADMSQISASTPLSDQISRDLKKAGFKFVGSVIIYAYMQAAGLVNDHLLNCSFR